MKPQEKTGSEIFTLYNTARKKEYCKETTFQKNGKGVIITRQYLANTVTPAAVPVVSFPQEETAQPGTIHYYELVKIVNHPGWQAEQVADWLATWFQFVKKELVSNGACKEEDFLDIDLKIDPGYIDAVPINVIVHEGRHKFIDLEVNLHEKIETGYLIFRAVYSSLSRLTSLAMPANPQYIEIANLVKYLFSRLGYSLTGEKLDEYFEKEALLVAAVAPLKPLSMKGSITLLNVRTPLQNLLLQPSDLLSLQQQNKALKKTIQLQEEKSAILKAKLFEQVSVIEKLAAELTSQQLP